MPCSDFFVPISPDLDHEDMFFDTYGWPPVHAPLPICDFLESWQESPDALEDDLSSASSVEQAEMIPPLREQPRRKRITRADLRGDEYDPQGIDWTALQASANDAHLWRQCPLTGQAVFRIPYHFQGLAYPVTQPIPLYRFRFAELATMHGVDVPHFDLRSVLACPSIAAYYYASRSTINHTLPCANEPTPLLDVASHSATFEEPWLEGGHHTAISTLTANPDLLAVGSFNGRYAYRALYANASSPFTCGIFPPSAGHFINHIALAPPGAAAPRLACLSSNGGAIGILDCDANRFAAQVKLPFAPNASAPNPDGRVHLVVGDGPQAFLVDSRIGCLDAAMPAHSATQAMACAWSHNLPSGQQLLATGAEDQVVRLFDLRRMKQPVHSLATETGGARILRFSPPLAAGDDEDAYNGDGSERGYDAPALLIAEPMDAVTLVSVGGPECGRTQRLEFFGEVSGADWVGGGRGRFVVAIADWRYGGLMEFERRREGEVWDGERDEEGLGWDRREDFDAISMCI